MSLHGTANSTQLSILTRALDEHCLSAGVLAESAEREKLASRVIVLFDRGVHSLEVIKLALADQRSSV